MILFRLQFNYIDNLLVSLSVAKIVTNDAKLCFLCKLFLLFLASTVEYYDFKLTRDEINLLSLLQVAVHRLRSVHAFELF